jgi:hypothetical protein
MRATTDFSKPKKKSTNSCYSKSKAMGTLKKSFERSSTAYVDGDRCGDD